MKTNPNNSNKSVQIVETKRVDGKVKQRIIQHIGIARDEKELEELKLFANSIKAKLEANGQLPLYGTSDLEHMRVTKIKKIDDEPPVIDRHKYDNKILKLNQLVLNRTKDLLNNTIDVVYFDATTICFESFNEDEMKKNGYSKDGKSNQPQIVLALLVTKQGLPVGYKAFSGDTFDGHTLLPAIREIKNELQGVSLYKVVYVADARICLIE